MLYAQFCYLLLRYHACLSAWGSSFTRLFTLIRAALRRHVDLPELLRSCGTFAAISAKPARIFPWNKSFDKKTCSDSLAS